MTNDYFAEALQEVAPASDSIMAQVAKGQKVFAPRPANVHAWDTDYDAVKATPVTGNDAFGYFG
jgi:hypothetical protein